MHAHRNAAKQALVRIVQRRLRLEACIAHGKRERGEELRSTASARLDPSLMAARPHGKREKHQRERHRPSHPNRCLSIRPPRQLPIKSEIGKNTFQPSHQLAHIDDTKAFTIENMNTTLPGLDQKPEGHQVKGGNGIGDSQPPDTRRKRNIDSAATSSPEELQHVKRGPTLPRTRGPILGRPRRDGTGARLAQTKKMPITTSGSSGTNPAASTRYTHTICEQVQRTRAQQHGDENEADRDFIGNHLRGGTQRRHEGIFRIRRPARREMML